VPAKTEFLQIRLTPAEKAALKRLAREAGLDVSSYVLSRAVPAARMRFAEILRELADAESPSFALAALNDLLTELAPAQLPDAAATADLSRLSPVLANYVAAMVEQASHRAAVSAPAWTAAVAPLDRPYFATDLPGLRLHLLRASPTPFKRRNLFVDAALGDRV
jgi:uncharacterized protein (DUF1778 family)